MRVTWRHTIAYTQSKTCAVCGVRITPFRQNGGVLTKPLWDAQTSCSRSCSKKLQNPSHRSDVRAKISSSLKEIGHKPRIRGGNGKGPSEPQMMLHKALGEGWAMEFVQNVWQGKKIEGVPNHLKIDIANPNLMLAIEVDGGSHGTLKRQEQDRRKEVILASFGWTVFRVSNAKAMSLSTISKSQDILRILLGTS